MNNSRITYEALNGSKNITGKNIRTYRLINKLSAQELSNQLMLQGLDLSAQTIYEIELGKRTITDYELNLIAKLLKITPNTLFGII